VDIVPQRWKFWHLRKCHGCMGHPHDLGTLHVTTNLFRFNTKLFYQPPDTNLVYEILPDEFDEVVPALTAATTLLEAMAIIRKTRMYSVE